MYRKMPQGWMKHWDFILVDEVVIILSFFLACMIRRGWENPFRSSIYRSLFFVVILVDLGVAVVFNTFSDVLKHRKYHLFLDSFKHASIVLMINITYTFVTQTGIKYSRVILFLMAGLHLFLGFGFKVLYRRGWHRLHSKKPLFVISTSERAESIADSIQSDISNIYTISEMAILDQSLTGRTIHGIPVSADAETLVPYLTRKWVNEVLFSADQKNEWAQKNLPAIVEMGITVHQDIGNLVTYQGEKQEVEKIGDIQVLTSAINTITGWNALLKRMMDILGGLVGGLIALIIMAFVAIPIKKESPGRLLYTSERIGLNGKRFKMYKIRSMHPDADDRKESLMRQNRVKDGMMFKLDWDPRVIGNERLSDGSYKTGIGEFIRKTSLDEFPQFFNVLKGEMSLVGTRPPTPDEWEKYEAHHRARMATKPGITGLWQVNGRSEITDFEEVVRLDREYITNWSLGLDIKLILKTIPSVLKGKGAM